MQKRILNLAYFCLLSTVLLVAPASAKQTLDLYRTTALVASQSETARSKAVRNGLANVVVRVSGRRDSVKEPLIVAAIKRSDAYLSSFSYGNSDRQLEVDGVKVPATELILKFSKVEVEALLRRAQLPLWPANRPNVLLWLVQDDRIEGRSYGVDTSILPAIRYAAGVRGMPLEQPILDLEDQMMVSVDSLWNFDRDSIQNASARYATDVVVVGRITEILRGGQSQWLANWQILRADGDNLLETQGDTAEAAILQGIERVADDLASRYAIVASDSLGSAVVLQLSGVENFGTYAQAIDYLEALPMVVSAQPSHAKGSELWLSLMTEGSLELLLNALEADQKLVSHSASAGNASLQRSRYLPQGSADNPLRYYWAQRSSAVIDIKGDIRADIKGDIRTDIKADTATGTTDVDNRSIDTNSAVGAATNSAKSVNGSGAINTLQPLSAPDQPSTHTAGSVTESAVTTD